MSVETEKEAATAAAQEIADAFRLSVAEAVNRLLSITPEERASNTDFERAARTALTFLKSAAVALSMSCAKRKEDAEHSRGEKIKLPSISDLSDLEAELAQRVSGQRRGRADADAAPLRDESRPLDGARP